MWVLGLLSWLAHCSTETSWKQTPSGRRQSLEQQKPSYHREGRMTCTNQPVEMTFKEVEAWKYFTDERKIQFMATLSGLCSSQIFGSQAARFFLLFRDLKIRKLNLFVGANLFMDSWTLLANEDRASWCSHRAFWTSIAFLNSPVLKNKGFKNKQTKTTKNLKLLLLSLSYS